ncbi:dihydrodipicolinate synthase family protein [Kordiimonas sediminis]|uniref:Dihydrodipicolinate synthase family protein n=1 Tax=Kordiimonas sediminis TaxID=1735581 RepID=A0A919AX05_9PROT|nr:dihydrodipicolinate synthase family protein [Kordiimonas sediminis]GHF30516.1 dihydrodipicolinate synthase family protein [Kordiimonas sediminis]
MIDWQGVYPATTTQFNDDESLNIEETQRVIDMLIKDGVDGIIALGTVGENCSLRAEEKRDVIAAVKEVANGRVPVISGVSQFTTAEACEYARDAEKIGIDGLMVLPAMVYKSDRRETLAHYKAVAQASDLPVMVYNNPVTYGIDITIDMFEELQGLANIVAVKESTADTRRVTEMFNAFGDRFTVFTGVDDIALESILMGCTGWISGLTNAFPQESVALFKLARAGRIQEAVEIYRWFMPLLRLDTIPTLVQCIKLAEQVMGRGSEMVRAPRLPLVGEERKRVIGIVEHAAANRPTLPTDI